MVYLTCIELLMGEVLMKILKIELDNFRVFNKAELDLSACTAIIGQNNAGKSAILQALRVFFNPAAALKGEGVPKHGKRNHWINITLTFSDAATFTPTGWSSRPEFRVRMRFKPLNRALTYDFFVGPTSVKQCTYDHELVQALFNNIRFVYVPAIRNHKEAEWQDGSVLYELVQTILLDRRSNQARKHFSQAIQSLQDKILSKIAKEVSDVYVGPDKPNIAITFPANIDEKFLMRELRIEIAEATKQFGAEEIGSGTQSLMVLALHQALAELTKTTYVLGIEEPEMGLHPQAQHFVGQAMAHGIAKRIQVIITTHSPHIVNSLGYQQCVLVNKIPGKDVPTSTVRQVTGGLSAARSEGFKKFWQAHKTDVLFARGVIVVEGRADEAVFRLLLERLEINPMDHGVSFLQVDGVNNLPYVFPLLRHLEIPYHVVLDKDYFFPYANKNKKLSYGATSILYRQSFKTSGIKILQDLGIDSAAISNLEPALLRSTFRAKRVLKNKHLTVMVNNLEADLVYWSLGHAASQRVLSVSTNPADILNMEKIKDPTTLVEIVSLLVAQEDLPLSYQYVGMRLKGFLETL